MQVETIIKNICQTIGEGPHWDETTQSLQFVDIIKGNVFNWARDTNELNNVHFDGVTSFIVPHKSSGYVVGVERTVVHADIDWKNSALTKCSTLATVDSGTTNRFNDAKCDASGRLWAGTMGAEKSPGQVDLHQGHLYSLETSGTVRHHLDRVSISNGLAWSHNNSVMYYIDSVPRIIYAFDFDLETGSISKKVSHRTTVITVAIGGQRDAINYAKREDGDGLGLPDGMCIDTEGKLWVANFFGGCVIRWDPVTGKEMQRVNVPAERVTSCCWGGPQLDELYVTSAGPWNMDAAERLRTPLAGSVFRITGLGAKGLPAPRYGHKSATLS